MRVRSITCNNCGAPLDAPAKARFLNCGYCESRLEVHESGGAVYTEVLEAIHQKTNDLADDVALLKL